MPVVGAVLYLTDPSVLDPIRADPRVTLGEPVGNKQPLVTATDSRAEDKALWRTLEALPGVLHVELAFAEFSDLTRSEVTP